MTVDKIVSQISQHSILNDKTKEVANNKKNRIEKDSNRIANDSNSDKVDFSSKAKKLQETESMLRFAMEKLESLDEVRNEKLDEVRENIEKGFYFSDQFDEIVSDKIFSNKEIANEVQKNVQKNKYLSDVKRIDKGLEEKIDLTKINDIKQKVANGFYDSQEAIEGTVDKIMEILL